MVFGRDITSTDDPALQEPELQVLRKGFARVLSLDEFAASDPKEGTRRLRAAILETLIPDEQREAAQSLPYGEYVRIRVQAIRSRLAEIVQVLRKTS